MGQNIWIGLGKNIETSKAMGDFIFRIRQLINHVPLAEIIGAITMPKKSALLLTLFALFGSTRAEETKGKGVSESPPLNAYNLIGIWHNLNKSNMGEEEVQAYSFKILNEFEKRDFLLKEDRNIHGSETFAFSLKSSLGEYDFKTGTFPTEISDGMRNDIFTSKTLIPKNGLKLSDTILVKKQNGFAPETDNACIRYSLAVVLPKNVTEVAVPESQARSIAAEGKGIELRCRIKPLKAVTLKSDDDFCDIDRYVIAQLIEAEIYRSPQKDPFTGKILKPAKKLCALEVKSDVPH